MALEEHPLRFSFQDGIMEDLCPRPEESAWVLNIKKGILTSLQNSMDSFKTEQNIVEVSFYSPHLSLYPCNDMYRKFQSIMYGLYLIDGTKNCAGGW